MNNQHFVLDVLRRLGASDAAALRSVAQNMDGTEVIAQDGCVPDFVSGKDYSTWPVGAPVSDDGQVWQLIQPYDSAAHPGRPGELRAMWGLCHTKDPSRAKAWVAPYGTSGMYMAGECYRAEDGTVYRCLVEKTNFDAAAMPGYWDEVTV